MYASRWKCLEIPTKGEKGRQMLETIKDREVRRRKGDEGFTLIELLVVIVILAILAAIVVFAVGGLNQKGQSEACKTDMKTIQTAEEAYFAKQSPGGTYASADELKAKGFITEVPSLHLIITPTVAAVNGPQYQVRPNPNNNSCTDPGDTYDSAPAPAPN
jgi:general secretion pathway protein G